MKKQARNKHADIGQPPFTVVDFLFQPIEGGKLKDLIKNISYKNKRYCLTSGRPMVAPTVYHNMSVIWQTQQTH
ncbi:MAG: hypothetical protein IJB74_00045 [Clostridia bacterium]|nr:hypothetical protein [Clostridia bacterium]